MRKVLLQTTYFGPIQWYQKLCRYDLCLIEQYDSYQKQTYRNRCTIATANGIQALTVPVEHTDDKMLVKDLRISEHNQWRRVHWNALQSAYSESPFFEYYADDLHPFFERKYNFLVDFNEDIRQKMCELIDIHPMVGYTRDFQTPDTPTQQGVTDLRAVINAKHPLPDPDFEATNYWQVFQHKHGFLTNLSILDLLFCMGPESIYYLCDNKKQTTHYT